ncbi:zinc-dependent alcohol dehydrogenase [Sporosarcina highlanderae]|uniref:Alcohol dehydrogenase catalytic domain-containing protein n=1 Tax=Sporosarcina highlanderae TaxID=3035916 RepID=A0ABT8JVG7_9BACL|nr:alcohol dehydrogenase catalytic domain-containing protein [Sporosarcina highlanderae]MDN4609171.1 alcohol dehydrogenase catalytic domain-containing protein [Sporosarcina highlanderae]
MNKMMAVIKARPQKEPFELTSVPLPSNPLEQEVTIKVESVGICGTDLSIYKWTENVAREYNPNFPFTPGHEFSGTIVKVGSSVEQLKVGDHVAVNPHMSCNSCDMCLEGNQNICRNRPILGCHANGGLVEYINVRAMNVFKLPHGFPSYLGSLAEPMSVAVHALEKVHSSENKTAVIIGAGTIGLLQYLTCKAAGYSHIFVTGLSQDKERLNLARSMGAKVINIENENPQDAIFEVIGRKEVDVVFEAAGTNESINLSIELVKPTGKVALIGIAASTTPIDTTKLLFSEKQLIGCRAYTLKTWDVTMDLIHTISSDLEKLVTHRFGMNQINEAINLIAERKCLKVIIEPHLKG